MRNVTKLKPYMCVMLCAVLGWSIAISMLEVARIHCDEDLS